MISSVPKIADLNARRQGRRQPGELYLSVWFTVTNMARSHENVVAFCNKRGACEQWIK